MGNCCVAPKSVFRKEKAQGKNKQNPFSTEYYSVDPNSAPGNKFWVLKDPTGRNISRSYDLGRELGRGEFGVTYLCVDVETREKYACKSISKKKLRTAIDVEDVRREVQIMNHMPQHPNIVLLKDTFEDEEAVHIVMELCEGGELFDRIVAKGHYTERAAADVMRTIVEVVQVTLGWILASLIDRNLDGSYHLSSSLQMCHRHGVMHRDLKPENFLFANKKESSPLKAIDFGLSMFFKPGTPDSLGYRYVDC